MCMMFTSMMFIYGASLGCVLDYDACPLCMVVYAFVEVSMYVMSSPLRLPAQRLPVLRGRASRMLAHR